MSVIDLTFILIHDTVDLVRQVWLMVSRLRHDHYLGILSSIPTTFVHIVLPGHLSNNDATRVTCVGKVERILGLIDTNECATRKTAVKSCLLLQLLLHLQVTLHERLPD